jgi:AraC-like DNA-binding protein/mannose-6-phosphate isomerase-like protein (cupin superfamily)
MTARRTAMRETFRRDIPYGAGSGPRAPRAPLRFHRLHGHRDAEVCIGSGATARPQLHEHAELRWITRGRVEIRCHGDTRRVDQGGAVLVPAQTLHEWSPADGGAYSFIALQLPADDLQRLRGDGAAGAHDDVPLATGRIDAIGCTDGATGVATAVGALLAWATRLQAHARARPACAVPSIDRAVDYVRRHAARKIGLDELAVAAGLSKFHFVRLFAATLGTTPHRYQMLVRVARARCLLRGRAPIADVALHTGFFDQSHFTRCFHEIVGVTPGRYLLEMTAPRPVRH